MTWKKDRQKSEQIKGQIPCVTHTSRYESSTFVVKKDNNVLEQYIGTLVGQCLGRIRFLTWIEPGADPDDLEFDIGVD